MHKKIGGDEEPRSYPKVGLVVGVTGIVGNSLAEILPLSDAPGGPWNEDHPIDYVQCDLFDPDDTQAKLSQLTDHPRLLRHLGQPRHRGRELRRQRRHAPRLVPNAPNLRHICLQAGGQALCGPVRVYRQDPGPRPTFHGRPAQTGRAQFLLHFGRHPPLGRGREESGPDLARTPPCASTRAGSCGSRGPRRRGGLRGGFGPGFDRGAADMGGGGPVRSKRGDVFRWKQLWKALAEQFGIEDYGFEEGEGVRLAELMKEKGPVWYVIARESELEVTKLEEVGVWWFADLVLGMESLLDGMNKSEEHGFLGFRNSVKSFVYWIQKMKAYKIVP
ncbi:3-oxo-Delta(4,5)-steroid 5-beta-reductase [Parasponia andersonii]|uniref:3-oxo-Delta(4,5)-steroid 5-beta-reductase n=1 Tax=Parasponia andersonii TaxID=3476 RepID=A0A2P5BZN1_PARAD|nr:3-oxo-Delta(4,5)-steroid 5-beta-reductase [Parasponia andersonii]